MNEKEKMRDLAGQELAEDKEKIVFPELPTCSKKLQDIFWGINEEFIMNKKDAMQKIKEIEDESSSLEKQIFLARQEIEEKESIQIKNKETINFIYKKLNASKQIKTIRVQVSNRVIVGEKEIIENGTVVKIFDTGENVMLNEKGKKEQYSCLQTRDFVKYEIVGRIKSSEIDCVLHYNKEKVHLEIVE